MQAEGHSAVADLGGSIITGIDGNPLAVLAAQLNIPLHDINTSGVPLYLEDGTEADMRIDAKVSPTPYDNLLCNLGVGWQCMLAPAKLQTPSIILS